MSSGIINCSTSPGDVEKIITCGGIRPMSDRQLAYEMRRFGDDRTYFLRPRFCATVAELYSVAQDPNVVMIHLGSFVGADGADGDAPLVFDIDVTDYKDYCSCECATERKTCHLCWPYVQAAMFVISSMLTDVLGVERGDQHWFYSGNRGVHCHVFVGGVVEIDDEARQGVIELLSHTTKIIEQPFHARMWPLFWDHFEKKIRPGNCHKLSAVFGTDVLNEKEHAMRSSWPKLDQAVTGRRSHMIRLPFTQHATSKRYSSAISCSTLDMLTWFPPHLAISAVVGAMKLD